MYRIGHLSDPHLPLPNAKTGELMNKRVLGWQSWHRRRKHILRPEILSILTSDITQSGVDHIVVTGDIGNISLPSEFINGRQWLETLGTPEKVTVIPGNHDAYIVLSWDAGFAHWGPYMQGDDRQFFPSVRLCGEVAVIGLSTAVPMPWFMAGGRLGEAQLKALDTVLADLDNRNLFRVVLLHHPPGAARGGWRKSLRDRAAFASVLAKRGAELVLHGHDHAPSLSKLSGPNGPIPVLGVPSASERPDARGYGAAWNRYDIQREGTGWRIALTIRGINRAADAMETKSQFDLLVG